VFCKEERLVTRKIKRGLLSLFVPVIMLAVVACPGIIIENIQITLGPSGAIVGGSVTFNCLSPITENIVTYKWIFGDGTTAEGQTVTHVYSAPGDYVVECHIATINSVLIFKKLLKMSVPAIVVDPFQHGGGGTTAFCGGGSSSGPSSLVLFGSRLESVTTTSGIGTVDVSLFNNYSFALTGDCAGEHLLRYPSAGFAATPVDLTSLSNFTIKVLSISGTANITLELHDGTNFHEIILNVGATGDFVYLLSDYDSNGVDLSQVSRVIFAVDATGPFSIEIAGPPQFE
jgi:hypothetical protein